jgi:hypothetical protein
MNCYYNSLRLIRKFKALSALNRALLVDSQKSGSGIGSTLLTTGSKIASNAKSYEIKKSSKKSRFENRSEPFKALQSESRLIFKVKYR